MSDLPNPDEIRSWLEWAGEKLLSMKIHGAYPASYRSFWPDYADDPHTAYGYTDNQLRTPPPGKYEIPLMDEILLLPQICELVPTRRILHARLLVYPLSGDYKYSWRKLAIQYHADSKTVKRWHERGLQEIIAKTPSFKLHRISLSLGDDVFAKI